MITDYDIIKKSYHREFDLITKLYLRETFPHSLIFHGPKESGKRKFVDMILIAHGPIVHLRIRKEMLVVEVARQQKRKMLKSVDMIQIVRVLIVSFFILVVMVELRMIIIIRKIKRQKIQNKKNTPTHSITMMIFICRI